MAIHSTITTQFLIISDTHNFTFDSPDADSYPLQLPTPKADVLLHCGDLTEVGGISSFEDALKMLSRIPAELKLVIPGNHDLELDQAYWHSRHSSSPPPADHALAVSTMTGPLATAAGVTYLTEGTHAFTLRSGARFSIHASPYTPSFGDWAFAYPPHSDRFAAIPPAIDILMTHGPPLGIRDLCPQGSVGCPQLLRALRRAKPLLHCFGHIHEGAGAEVVDWALPESAAVLPRKNEAVHRFFEDEPLENPYPEPFVWREGRGRKTLAVNAAVMGGRGRWEGVPWLVSLELRREVGGEGEARRGGV
ncbi:hypothetical protein MMC13_003749 [Lambiella insularis]|nr:hypothetical protein [Lambiella insularis]